MISTIISGIEKAMDDPDLTPTRWKDIVARGCDLCGWGTPNPESGWPDPDKFTDDFDLIREVFRTVD